MLLYDEVSKKCHLVFEKLFCFLYPEKRMVGSSSTCVGGLTKLTEASDTFNYEPFFKSYIIQTILHKFLLLIFVWNKIFCS